MTYEAWRISYQDSEQAARAAYRRAEELAAKLAELEQQKPVAWLYDWQAPEGLIKDWVETNRDEIQEGATSIRPLYARPVPAEPVNARLLTALKVCRHKFAQYVAHHISKGDMHKAMANESMVAMADVAIMGAEAAPRVARLTHPDIAKALASAGLKPEDYREDGEILPLVIAIESATLRKNGIEVAE